MECMENRHKDASSNYVITVDGESEALSERDLLRIVTAFAFRALEGDPLPANPDGVLFAEVSWPDDEPDYTVNDTTYTPDQVGQIVAWTTVHAVLAYLDEHADEING